MSSSKSSKAKAGGAKKDAAPQKDRAREARAENPAQDEEQDSNLQTDQPDKPIPMEEERPVDAPSERPREEEPSQSSTETPEKPQEQPEKPQDDPDTAEPSPPQPQQVPKPEEPQPVGAEAPPEPEPSADRPSHRRDARISGQDQAVEVEQMRQELDRANEVHLARTAGESVSA